MAFSFTAAGEEIVLHTFGLGADGSQPKSSLKFLNGRFCGTTNSAGPNSGGTIFSISKSGREVSERPPSGTDGIFPPAGLAGDKGVLYGNTDVGGGNACGGYGCGTVFSYTP